MMRDVEVSYLRDCIRDHLRWCFTEEARAQFEAVPLRWCKLTDATMPTAGRIHIPVDIPAIPKVNDVWTVPFGNTALTLWNRITPPSDAWTVDDPSYPLWYRHANGALLPTWNLAPLLFDLLTLREEHSTSTRDEFGRFTAQMSPRYVAGVINVPVFNESVAALVAAADGLLRTGVPARALRHSLRHPPALVLSHDLDQLRGNDFWTQAVRATRIIRPRAGGGRLANVKHIAVNAAAPRRYFFDNIVGMLAIERMLGYTSTLYFLNGRGGRFGARSGAGMIPEVASLASDGWPLGMHYNIDTYLDTSRFTAQRDELASLLRRPITAGRAHYLRFASDRSWPFLVKHGIQIDESLGYPDAVGYRAGIAGPFRPYDEVTGCAFALLEMPMVAMEAELAVSGPAVAEQRFSMLLAHLAEVGGAISLLFHPGQFDNPEYPETRGLYRRLLDVARRFGARSMPAPAWPV